MYSKQYTYSTCNLHIKFAQIKNIWVAPGLHVICICIFHQLMRHVFKIDFFSPPMGTQLLSKYLYKLILEDRFRWLVDRFWRPHFDTSSIFIRLGNLNMAIYSCYVCSTAALLHSHCIVLCGARSSTINQTH